MRVALCQVNPTVGDFAGNRARILAMARRAADEEAHLAIFPELALCGYPPRDLLDVPAFVEQAERALTKLADELPRGVAVLLGTVQRGPAQAARPLRNVAVLLLDGQVRATIAKRLLPTYDVFDEDRYFEPGGPSAPFVLDGVRFGVTICEDAWNDVETPLQERRYPVDQVPLDRALALDALGHRAERIAQVAPDQALVDDARQAARAGQHAE